MAHRQYDLTARRSRLTGLIVLAFAGALTLALSLFLTSRTAAPTVLWIDLRTVSADKLNSAGITLLPPPRGAEASTVPQSVAELKVTERHPSTAIKELVLARLIDQDGRIDTLAWVVSLDPAAIGVSNPRGEKSANEFALVFVDAKTGDVLYGMVAGHGVEPQPGAVDATQTASP